MLSPRTLRGRKRRHQRTRLALAVAVLGILSVLIVRGKLCYGRDRRSYLTTNPPRPPCITTRNRLKYFARPIPLGHGVSKARPCSASHASPNHAGATGRKLRVLTIVDTFSRYSPAVEPRFNFRGADVVQILEDLG